MCSLAPRSALGFGATAGARSFLDRRQGVAAVAPAACGETAREPTRRVGAEVFSAPTKKRARNGFDDTIGVGEVSVVSAPGQQILEERLRTELDALRHLLNKAVLLSRGAAPAGKDDARFMAVKPRPEVPTMETAAKRRKTSPSKPAAEATHQITEPVVKQQRPVQRAPPPRTTTRPTTKPIDKAMEILKRRRLEEIAREREKFRQKLLEVEKAALPDETIYPEDLEELGIAPFE